MIKNTRKNLDIKNFLKKRGAYLFLALCVAASGIGAWSSVRKTLNFKTDISAESNYMTEKAVEKNETGVPDERVTKAEPYTQKIIETTTEEESIDMAAEYCAFPLSIDIVKDYSNGEMVYSKTLEDYRVHNGIDFAGVEGDQVKAIYNGTVKDVYDDELWGTVVIIDHGAFIAKYCGLQSGSTVTKDAKVKINDVVGLLGKVPIESADDAHIHIEILVDGQFTDPLSAMNKTAEDMN